MAIYVKQVMTKDGPAQIDYKSLANLPTIDATIIDGSKNAVQGNAVYDALANKLGINATAANSAKFGGQPPSYYVSNEDLQQFAEDMGLEVDANTGAIESLGELLNTKLDATAQAADSAKLNGQAASYYATKTGVDAAQKSANDAQQAANDAQATANQAVSSATSAGTTATEALNKVNTLITDVTAIKYVTALPSNPDSTTLYLIKK